MFVFEHPNGDLVVPRRAELDGILGDGEERITPEHPDYEKWRNDIARGIVELRPVMDHTRRVVTEP